MSKVDYSDLEFDEEKYYLGTLCKRGHNWKNTGCSLRRIMKNHNTGACRDCELLQYKKVNNICETCGDSFTTDRVARFCSRSCFFASHNVFVECVFCGGIFKRRKNLYEKLLEENTPQFCSKLCSNKHHAIGSRITIKCEWCRKEKTLVASKVVGKYHKQRFCSNKCSGLAQRNPHRHEITLCEYCREEYEPTKDPNQKFCSRKCSNLAKIKKDGIYTTDPKGRHRWLGMRQTHWKEVMPMLDSMKDSEYWEEVIDASIKERLLIADLRKTINNGSA